MVGKVQERRMSKVTGLGQAHDHQLPAIEDLDLDLRVTTRSNRNRRPPTSSSRTASRLSAMRGRSWVPESERAPGWTAWRTGSGRVVRLSSRAVRPVSAGISLSS